MTINHPYVQAVAGLLGFEPLVVFNNMGSPPIRRTPSMVNGVVFHPVPERPLRIPTVFRARERGGYVSYGDHPKSRQERRLWQVLSTQYLSEQPHRDALAEKWDAVNELLRSCLTSRRQDDLMLAMDVLEGKLGISRRRLLFNRDTKKYGLDDHLVWLEPEHLKVILAVVILYFRQVEGRQQDVENPALDVMKRCENYLSADDRTLLYRLMNVD